MNSLNYIIIAIIISTCSSFQFDEQESLVQSLVRKMRHDSSKIYYDKLKTCVRTTFQSDTGRDAECVLKRMFRPLFLNHETKCKNCAK